MAEDVKENEARFLADLIANGLLLPSGVPGVYGRSGAFEDVIAGVVRVIDEMARPDHAEVMRFPPIVSRKVVEQSGYLKSFPTLAGSVHSFRGKDQEHAALLRAVEGGEDWAHDLPSTEVMLTPAACYPVYPLMAGTLPDGGRTVDLYTYCFRHEPSGDPARMQAFRQREFVAVGEPDDVRAFRERWLERAKDLVSRLALPGHADVANDPFFGRGGRFLALDQRERSLKFEMLVPVCSTERPTACISFNYHEDHFGQLFAIKSARGGVAHTACVGFGVERLALAMLKTHGIDPSTWPAPVRSELGS